MIASGKLLVEVYLVMAASRVWMSRSRRSTRASAVVVAAAVCVGCVLRWSSQMLLSGC